MFIGTYLKLCFAALVLGQSEWVVVEVMAVDSLQAVPAVVVELESILRNIFSAVIYEQNILQVRFTYVTLHFSAI
jgi:hypothetical protein